MTEEEFLASLPLDLSEQQRAAVLAGEGPVLLLAVPGSGKTTVLVARLGCLIRCRGISPKGSSPSPTPSPPPGTWPAGCTPPCPGGSGSCSGMCWGCIETQAPGAV